MVIRLIFRTYQRHLAQLWLQLGQLQFNQALANVSAQRFKPGLKCLGDLYRSVEEAKIYKGERTSIALGLYDIPV